MEFKSQPNEDPLRYAGQCIKVKWAHCMNISKNSTSKRAFRMFNKSLLGSYHFTIYNLQCTCVHATLFCIHTHLQGSVYFAKPPLNNLTQHHLMQSLFIKYGVKFRLKASVLYKIRRKMFICCISISSCNLACSFACRWLAAMNKMEWNGTRSLVQKPYKYSHPTPKYLRNIYAIVRSHGIIILGYFFIGAVKHSTRCSSSLSLSLVLLFLWIIHGEWTVNTNQ